MTTDESVFAILSFLNTETNPEKRKAGLKVIVDKMLAAEREHQTNLYIAINEMMAELGLNGQIDTRHPKTDAVMNALYDIDGGEYKPEAIRRGE